MRIFLIILILFVEFGCQTNHYLSEPVMGIPTIGLQESLKSNGIIIATNYNLKADTFDIEECMLGLKLNINAKSQIKIVDDLCFIKRPNAERLNGLQQNFILTDYWC